MRDRKPLFLYLSNRSARLMLQERNGWTGAFQGDFSGYYYQWNRGGPIEGPFLELAVAIEVARREGREAIAAPAARETF